MRLKNVCVGILPRLMPEHASLHVCMPSAKLCCDIRDFLVLVQTVL